MKVTPTVGPPAAAAEGTVLEENTQKPESAHPVEGEVRKQGKEAEILLRKMESPSEVFHICDHVLHQMTFSS